MFSVSWTQCPAPRSRAWSVSVWGRQTTDDGRPIKVVRRLSSVVRNQRNQTRSNRKKGAKMKVSIGKKGALRLAALVGLGLAACVGLLGNGGQAQAGIPANSSLAHTPLMKVEQRVLDDTAYGQPPSFVVLM